jgi:hypothetical protein
MIADAVIGEIKRKLRRGYPQGELINDLLKEGYTDHEIEEAFYKLSNPDKNTKKTTSFPLWYVICTGLLITGIAILNIFHNSALGFLFLIPGIAGIIIRYIMNSEKK